MPYNRVLPLVRGRLMGDPTLLRPPLVSPETEVSDRLLVASYSRPASKPLCIPQVAQRPVKRAQWLVPGATSDFENQAI